MFNYLPKNQRILTIIFQETKNVVIRFLQILNLPYIYIYFFFILPSDDAQKVGEGHPSMHLTIYCLHTYTIQSSA